MLGVTKIFLKFFKRFQNPPATHEIKPQNNFKKPKISITNIKENFKEMFVFRKHLLTCLSIKLMSDIFKQGILDFLSMSTF